MDLVEYRGVQFPIVRTLGVEREEMLDPSGSTYLHTRWRCNFVVTYNPSTIVYKPGVLSTKAGVAPSPPIPGVHATGIMPASTDLAIRSWIGKPRGLLIIWSNGNQVLRSPGTVNGRQLLQDATTGPIMKVGSIVFIPGERRWDIHLSIEACVNEPQFDTSVGQQSLFPIVSNRWYGISETDFQQKTVRAYQGLVTVRGDFMTMPGSKFKFMDQLRNNFASFSVPKGFQRVAVNVRAMPDGNSCEYTVVDSQMMWNKDARKGKSDTDFTRVCPALKLDIQDSAWISQINQTLTNHPELLIAGGLLSGLTQIARHGLGGMVPKAYRRIQIRTWGASTMNRAIIAQFCINVAVARLGTLALFDVANEELMVNQDTDNFVECTMTRSWDYTTLGALASVAVNFLVNRFVDQPAGVVASRGAAGARAAMTANPDYLYFPPPAPAGPPLAPPVQVVPDQAPRDFVQAFPRWPDGTAHNGITVNPPFLDSGARGTYLESLVTQILEPPDGLPANPP